MNYEKKSRAKETAEEQKDREAKAIEERRQKFQARRTTFQKNGIAICKHCDFLGMVTALEKETGNTFAFRCSNCEAADELGLSKTISEWNSSRTDQFEILLF